MHGENAPRGKRFSIFDEQTSSSVATNVVQKPYNNKLHFEVDPFQDKNYAPKITYSNFHTFKLLTWKKKKHHVNQATSINITITESQTIFKKKNLETQKQHSLDALLKKTKVQQHIDNRFFS